MAAAALNLRSAISRLPIVISSILDQEDDEGNAIPVHRVFLAAIYDAPQMADDYITGTWNEQPIGHLRKEVMKLETTANFEGNPDTITPPEVAIVCGSLRFLEWWHVRIGRMPLKKMLDIACRQAVPKSLEWLIENKTKLLPKLNDRDLETLFGSRDQLRECLEAIGEYECYDLSERTSPDCLRLLAPFTKQFHDYPTLQDRGTGDLGALIMNPRISTETYNVLHKDWGHGPTTSNWTEMFPWLFHISPYAAYAPYGAAHHFWLVLEDFFPEEEDKIMIVKHFSKDILRYFKLPRFLRFILKHEILPLDANLVASIHGIDPEIHTSFISRTCRDIFDGLIMVLPNIAAKNNGCAASSWDLAAAISNVKALPATSAKSTRKAKAIEGFNGLVRLLLYFGAEPDHVQVRKAIRLDSEGEYKGLIEDILDVERWKRWEQSGNFCGLPSEITRMVMFRVWRGTFKTV